MLHEDCEGACGCLLGPANLLQTQQFSVVGGSASGRTGRVWGHLGLIQLRGAVLLWLCREVSNAVKHPTAERTPHPPQQHQRQTFTSYSWRAKKNLRVCPRFVDSRESKFYTLSSLLGLFGKEWSPET